LWRRRFEDAQYVRPEAQDLRSGITIHAGGGGVMNRRSVLRYLVVKGIRVGVKGVVSWVRHLGIGVANAKKGVSRGWCFLLGSCKG